MFIVLLFISIVSSTYAGIGAVASKNANQASLVRNLKTNPLITNPQIQLGDEIKTSLSDLDLQIFKTNVSVHLYKQSSIKIVKAIFDQRKGGSVITLEILLQKGGLNLKAVKHPNVKIDIVVQSDLASFHSSAGGVFKVGLLKDQSLLDVLDGEVEVRSPLISTFVPEIVKSNEGFSFTKSKKQFSRRKITPL